MGAKQSTPPAHQCADGSAVNLDEDVKKWQEMMTEMETLFTGLCSRHTGVGRTFDTCRGLMLKPVNDFVKELVDNARPPVIYLLGRSGHGKSSLINALAKQKVAEVGHAAPTTAESAVYDIPFGGNDCSWKVIDSRGVFETTRPQGAKNLSAHEQVKKDVLAYKPDIIIHVVCCSEVRNLNTDMKFLNEIFQSIQSTPVDFPPVIVVLTKADIIGHTQQWPPYEYPPKKKLLEDLLGYMCKEILSAKECEPLVPDAEFCGYKLDGCKPFLYVIPVATIEEEPIIRWNIDELSLVIGNKIPCQAWLYFYKGHEHKKAIKDLTGKVIDKFSAMATAMFFSHLYS